MVSDIEIVALAQLKSQPLHSRIKLRSYVSERDASRGPEMCPSAGRYSGPKTVGERSQKIEAIADR